MILINDTTHNTVTGYISAGGGEKIFKKWTEKKNWCLSRPEIGLHELTCKQDGRN